MLSVSGLALAVVLALPLLAAGGDARAAAAAASAPPAAHEPAAAFATVGNTVISRSDYQRALAVATRNKYYHAKPPEGEYPKFQREVGDELVNRVLLLAEARRRGIQPDRDAIAATVAGYDAQYRNSANWQARREQMLAAVLPQLESDSLLARLDALVARVPEPADAVARTYYERHKALFVEPEQVKLSVILLRVDPSSPQAVWNSAKQEGQQIHKRLLAGADFGELARLHSGDRSAPQGGQMDYTHRGMLPEALHAVVDALKPREISAAVQTLEGVVILRLDDRRAASQRSFEQVRERAADLWQRDEAKARRDKLIAELRRATTIRIDESLYAPLPASADKARAG